jgi:hypothetical protein
MSEAKQPSDYEVFDAMPAHHQARTSHENIRDVRDALARFGARPAAEPTVLANLRHLYANMINGAVRDTASAKRIATTPAAPAEALSDDRIDQIIVAELGLDADEYAMAEFARAIERAHGIGASPTPAEPAQQDTQWVKCDWCNNTGAAGRSGDPCYKCKGAGSLPPPAEKQAAPSGEDKPVERCQCGYPMPCAKTVPITLCRARRAARAMGHEPVITYTLPSEGGASLRAAGFMLDKTDAGGPSKNWSSRPGRAVLPIEDDLVGGKLRWRDA